MLLSRIRVRYCHFALHNQELSSLYQVTQEYDWIRSYKVLIFVMSIGFDCVLCNSIFVFIIEEQNCTLNERPAVYCFSCSTLLMRNA